MELPTLAVVEVGQVIKHLQQQHLLVDQAVQAS
jgi:hypothetical protein